MNRGWNTVYLCTEEWGYKSKQINDSNSIPVLVMWRKEWQATLSSLTPHRWLNYLLWLLKYVQRINPLLSPASKLIFTHLKWKSEKVEHPLSRSLCLRPHSCRNVASPWFSCRHFYAMSRQCYSRWRFSHRLIWAEVMPFVRNQEVQGSSENNETVLDPVQELLGGKLIVSRLAAPRFCCWWAPLCGWVGQRRARMEAPADPVSSWWMSLAGKCSWSYDLVDYMHVWWGDAANWVSSSPLTRNRWCRLLIRSAALIAKYNK